MKHIEALISDYFVQHPNADQVIITNLTAAHFDLKGPALELQEKL